MYKKIIVTGNAGSGKTTLSKKIATIFKFNEIIHLDKLVWEHNWTPVSKEIKEKRFEELKKQPSWIIDGVSKILLLESDTIIFLDFPRHTCYFRAIKRTLKYLFRSRPELNNQYPEIYVLKKIINIIWNFDKAVKPGILKQIEKHSQTKSIYHVKNNSELERLLKHLSFASITTNNSTEIY